MANNRTEPITIPYVDILSDSYQKIFLFTQMQFYLINLRIWNYKPK